MARAGGLSEARQASTTIAETAIWPSAATPWVAEGMHSASTEQPASRLSRRWLGLRKAVIDWVVIAMNSPAALGAQTVLANVNDRAAERFRGDASWVCGQLMRPGSVQRLGASSAAPPDGIGQHRTGTGR